MDNEGIRSCLIRQLLMFGKKTGSVYRFAQFLQKFRETIIHQGLKGSKFIKPWLFGLVQVKHG
jgi:hypothetical protein